MVIENKFVFGVNIMLYSSVLRYDNFVVMLDNILGWLDYCGLLYFVVKVEIDNLESEDMFVFLFL